MKKGTETCFSLCQQATIEVQSLESFVMTVEEMSLRLRPLLLSRSLSKIVQIKLEGDPFSYFPTSFLFPSRFFSFVPSHFPSLILSCLLHPSQACVTIFSCFHLSIHPLNSSSEINISAGLRYSRRLFSPVSFRPASFSSFSSFSSYSQSQSYPTISMPYLQTLPHSQSGFPMQHAPQPASTSSLANQPLPPKTAIP